MFEELHLKNDRGKRVMSPVNSSPHYHEKQKLRRSHNFHSRGNNALKDKLKILKHRLSFNLKNISSENNAKSKQNNFIHHILKPSKFITHHPQKSKLKFHRLCTNSPYRDKMIKRQMQLLQRISVQKQKDFTNVYHTKIFLEKAVTEAHHHKGHKLRSVFKTSKSSPTELIIIKLRHIKNHHGMKFSKPKSTTTKGVIKLSSVAPEHKVIAITDKNLTEQFNSTLKNESLSILQKWASLSLCKKSMIIGLPIVAIILVIIYIIISKNFTKIDELFKLKEHWAKIESVLLIWLRNWLYAVLSLCYKPKKNTYNANLYRHNTSNYDSQNNLNTKDSPTTDSTGTNSATTYPSTRDSTTADSSNTESPTATNSPPVDSQPTYYYRKTYYKNATHDRKFSISDDYSD